MKTKKNEKSGDRKMLFLTVSITIQTGTPTKSNLSMCALGPKRAWAEDPLKIKMGQLGCSFLAQLQKVPSANPTGDTHQKTCQTSPHPFDPALQFQPSSAVQHP